MKSRGFLTQIKMNNYIKIYDWMLAQNLTSNEVLILGLIASFKVCICTEEFMAEKLRCSRKSISRSIKKLVSLGLLSAEKTDGNKGFRLFKIVDKMSQENGQNVPQKWTKCPSDTSFILKIKDKIKEKEKEKEKSEEVDEEMVKATAYLRDPRYIEYMKSLKSYGKS